MIYKSYIYFYNFFFNYPTPANLTTVWNFGVLSFIFLIIQIISGLGLSMYYVPNEELAFVFVEYIMRDTYVGWFFRYVHSNGASLFFFFVYLHMFRSLFYFSYINPKTVVWNTGVIILLLMIITAFTGYVLPRGQMSFRACTVITNLVTVIPFFGPDTVRTIWGSYGVSNITLNRFYTVHFILPFIIFLIMVGHFYYLHQVGSSNATKIKVIDDKMKFHPYYTWKDAVVVVSVISLYIFIIMSTPNYLSHADNYIQADSLVTPTHIVPEWYFLTFYAMLRAVPNKLAGVFVLIASILILMWFPTQFRDLYQKEMWQVMKSNSLNLRVIKHYFVMTKKLNPLIIQYTFWIFVADFVALSYLGMQPVEEPYYVYSGWCTLIYFSYFLCLIYIHSFQIWLIDMKGNYVPLMINIFMEIFLMLQLFKKNFYRAFSYLFPTAFKKYILFINFLKNFIFSKIVSKDTLDKLVKWWDNVVKEAERIHADYLWNKDFQDKDKHEKVAEWEKRFRVDKRDHTEILAEWEKLYGIKFKPKEKK